MEQVVSDLLRDIREHLNEDLKSEIMSYTTVPRGDMQAARLGVEADALIYIEPLERLIGRIDEVMADNSGSGI